MFERKYFDDDDDLIFDPAAVEPDFGMGMSQILPIAGGVFVIIVLLVLCYRCCCMPRRRRGQILSPAPVVQVTTQQTPAPYPQQQYSSSYPAQMVTAYPVAAPYPMEHQAYPPAGYPAPYPAQNPMPYPAPYPQPSVQSVGPYPMAPSAPDANVFFGIAPPGWNQQALPPSYDQAVCAKQPAHNPQMPR